MPHQVLAAGPPELPGNGEESWRNWPSACKQTICDRFSFSQPIVRVRVESSSSLSANVLWMNSKASAEFSIEIHFP